MHTHTDDPHRINFKKPGAPAAGQHAPGLTKYQEQNEEKIKVLSPELHQVPTA